MKKLRFKNRGGVLYFGVDGKFISSKMKFNQINKNILIGKFNRGEIDSELSINDNKSSFVIDLVQQVLDNKSKHLKHKTMLAYKSSYSVHILPFFKNKLVSEIKPLTIKEFQDSIVDKGLKKDSVQLCRILLKEAFDYAVLNDAIQSNPVKSVSMPKIRYTKKKAMPFSLDEIDLLLESSSNQLKNFLGISFFTGMRSGELLALTWDDIDFKDNTIKINKTVAQGIINSAKTRSSERDIEMLDKAREFFKNQRLITGLKNSYVFLNKKGTHYSSNDLFYYMYQKLLESVGLERRALHNTRHTFASIMLNNGIDALWVSHTLGHENLHITLSIYTHFLPKKEKMVLPFLEKRYKNGTHS